MPERKFKINEQHRLSNSFGNRLKCTNFVSLIQERKIKQLMNNTKYQIRSIIREGNYNEEF